MYKRFLMGKELIIIRGLPSAGKTTVAKMFGRAICSADDYFTYGEKYLWTAEETGTAHRWCQRKCRRFMERGIGRVIIANTNTTEKELQPYIDLANEFDYMIFSIIVETRHNNKNNHNVPQAAVDKMRFRFSIKL